MFIDVRLVHSEKTNECCLNFTLNDHKFVTSWKNLEQLLYNVPYKSY